MKLVLASQGLTTPDLANSVARLVGKPLKSVNVAIINEAYVGISAGRDETWLITELSQILQYMKSSISFVNIRAHDLNEIAERLEFADLIYIVGGAQLVLPQLFKATGFDTLLAQLAETKVIMGTSAGANILGRHIEDPDYWQDQYGSSDQYLANPYLGLVDFNILPHFERADHPLRTTQMLTPLLKEHPFTLYGVTDTQAVVFNNGIIEFIGGEPVTFGSVKN